MQVHAINVAGLPSSIGDQLAGLINGIGVPLSTEVLDQLQRLPDGSNAAVRAALAPTNPHIPYVEGERRGVALCQVDAERWRTTFRIVDDPADPVSAMSTLTTWEVARGTAGAEQA